MPGQLSVEAGDVLIVACAGSDTHMLEVVSNAGHAESHLTYHFVRGRDRAIALARSLAAPGRGFVFRTDLPR